MNPVRSELKPRQLSHGVVEDVQALVLGGHGDTMVPLVHSTTVAGIPVTELMSKESLERLITRTWGGGGEIVKLLKTGCAYYAPAAAIAQMAESILLDKKRIFPCCSFLEGEYYINGLCVGVPVKLGAGGREEIVQITLSPDEKVVLQNSAAAVRELVDVMHRAQLAKAG
jgi:malate dehydrogenase